MGRLVADLGQQNLADLANTAEAANGWHPLRSRWAGGSAAAQDPGAAAGEAVVEGRAARPLAASGRRGGVEGAAPLRGLEQHLRLLAVPHTLVKRRRLEGHEPGGEYDALRVADRGGATGELRLVDGVHSAGGGVLAPLNEAALEGPAAVSCDVCCAGRVKQQPVVDAPRGQGNVAHVDLGANVHVGTRSSGVAIELALLTDASRLASKVDAAAGVLSLLRQQLQHPQHPAARG
mmetsp:Transcript_17439/g.48613  ORF Transcript_17439/g.48613 Transcript_17439/m.48613 type:complete len:234 (+) Transcript_17439:2232-2933(+)